MTYSGDLLLFTFFSMMGFIYAAENATGPMDCHNATAASDVDFGLLHGIWYVQMYTGPSGGTLQTKCDVLNITLNDDSTAGSINYTFVNVGKGDAVVQVANLTVETELHGVFSYSMDFQEKHLVMHATVLHLDKDFLVHAACPDKFQGIETLLIASKKQMMSGAELQPMVDLAAKQGGKVANVQLVDHKTCHHVTDGSSTN